MDNSSTTPSIRQFDALNIIAHAGGSAALRAYLAADNAGVTPDKATVAMWKHRRRIAGPWLAACVLAVLRRDPTLTVEDLVTPDDPGDLFAA